MSKSREIRLAAQQDRWNALQDVIRIRSVEYAENPVGSTGYYTRKFKIQGSRGNPVVVEEYSLDTRLLHELRAIEQQIATERGEWKDGTHIKDPDPLPSQALALASFFTREEIDSLDERMLAQYAKPDHPGGPGTGAAGVPEAAIASPGPYLCWSKHPDRPAGHDAGE